MIYLNQFNVDKKKIKILKDKDFLYTPFFKDNQNEVYTFFKNGIVKTTVGGSQLIDFTQLDGQGYIWESSIKDQVDEIIIYPKENKKKGNFETFCEYAFKYQDDDGKWKLDEGEYESFRTVYGYMLSTYTNSGDTPCPIFVDKGSDGEKAEGGNGKSLVLKSIREWKRTLGINGKNIDKKDKFLFSGVNMDTQFVYLDDVESDFNFNILYNLTTGDFEYEKKFKDRYVIDQDDKPKIAISTNYILPSNDWSTKRRQYIVEFGNYWNHYTKVEGKSVAYFFGGNRLFDNWDYNQWQMFFNFGFRCIQEYLIKGVIENEHNDYQSKQLVSQIEGVGVNDGVVDWIINYIEDNQKELTSKDEKGKWKGVNQHSIYAVWMTDPDVNQDLIERWDSTRFFKAIYDICVSKEWKYNAHKVGKTQSQKRYLYGKRGEQVPHIVIDIS